MTLEQLQQLVSGLYTQLNELQDSGQQETSQYRELEDQLEEAQIQIAQLGAE